MQPISKALEIQGWMTATELEWLRKTALNMVKKDRRAQAAELGSWLGRSTVAIAIPGIDLFCVDTFRGTPGVPNEATGVRDIYAEFMANMTRLRLRPIVVRLYAITAAAMFPDYWFDWIFLDCDKEKFPAQFRAWYPKLKTRGLYSGHDHSPEFPLVQRTLMNTGIDYSVVYGTSIWCFKKPYIS